MHFGLTEEQKLLQQTLRGFAAAECPPQRLRRIFDAGDGHDAAIWRALSKMGLAGLLVPEEFGGAGFEILDLALACEIAGEAALPGALLEHSLACLAIAESGSAEQRARWLPRLASGETIGTIALFERDADSEIACDDGWSPGAWATRSSQAKLRGVKHYVPHLAHAGLVVVGVAGGGLCALELRDDATAGVRREREEGIDRTRSIGTLVLEDAAAEELTNATPARVRKLLDAGLVGLAADAFGAASRLIELSVAYAADRKQFGLPIAQFQAVKHQLARMATEIEPTRALVWYAAHALDRALPDAERHAAIAKAHITARTTDVARDAVEVHGGLGFTWECDVQMWFKRAMYDRAFLGTPELHHERMATLAGW